MIKMIAASRRRVGMTHSAFVRYMRDVHGQLTRDNPLAVARYVQNHAFDGAFGSAAYGSFFHRDAVAELSFASIADLMQTFAHPVTREVIAPDGANFSDLPTAISLLVEEHSVITPPLPGFGGVKLWHWLKLAEGVTDRNGTVNAAADAWTSGPAGSFLRGHVRHFPLADAPSPPTQASSEPAKAHFGGGTMPRFDAVLVSWLDSTDDLNRIECGMDALTGGGAFDQATCFTLHTTETLIFEAPAVR